MNLRECTIANMDRFENTHAHYFLDHIYNNAINKRSAPAPVLLLDQLKYWFGIEVAQVKGLYVPSRTECDDSHFEIFIDAMLRGKTVDAAYELAKLFKFNHATEEWNDGEDEPSKYLIHFLRTLQCVIHATVSDPDTVDGDIAYLFESDIPMKLDYNSLYGKHFLQTLGIAGDKFEPTNERVVDAAYGLVKDAFFSKVAGDIPEEVRPLKPPPDGLEISAPTGFKPPED